MLDLLIVTGASRGIGEKIARTCAALSKRTIVIGASSAIETKFSSHQNITPLQVDLSNFTQVQERLRAILPEGMSRVGVALCAAQIGTAGGIMQADFDAWDYLYRCNVLGNLSVLKTVLSHLTKSSTLRVVFFAGGGAAYGYPDFSGYALSKVAVVRAVENIGLEFESSGYDASIVALAPGAVETDMLAIVLAHGGAVKTRTDISEPVTFVRKFICDDFPTKELNGRFVHVRDTVSGLDYTSLGKDHFKLRRVE